ncbi:putative dipeptidyl-aminopeptidase B [Grifola frondosa]|uniref:Putative dipeptidyl-aminopeptidase B n=1 Tax=Grifola frondosa TaxID=5627 RepID=A0A1C7MAU3_GRIFR|nr:putative dipeptidyl-aminopeptidase B [Grifola frondosa]
MRSHYEPLSQEGDLRGSTSSGFSQANDISLAQIKPEIYYEEGPFDPPSSDDEADELLEKSSRHTLANAERGGGTLDEDGELIVGKRARPSSIRALVISIVVLISIATVIGIVAARSYTGTAYRIQGMQHITMDHVFNGTFAAAKQNILWVPEAGDGVFASSRGGYIALVDLKTNSTKNLVAIQDVKDEHGHKLIWSDWKLSSDRRYMLIKANARKQWRHSSFGNYYIHDLATGSTYPLIPPSSPPVTAYAQWSPTGQSIAFVTSNDLYIIPSPSPTASPIRVTTSGNASLFHGVPDWVYEEEVFSSDYALWWSPDSAKVAYLRFDETAVDEFTYPVYNPSEDSYAVVPYPGHVTMKYPKPGYNNPLVSMHIFELDEYLANMDNGDNITDVIAASSMQLTWDGQQTADNAIIAEGRMGRQHDAPCQEVTRAAENGNSERTGKKEITVGLNLVNNYPISAELSPDGYPAYLDIVPSPLGYNHIALFSPANSSTPRFLTSGQWEVTGDILAVDTNRSIVYFQAANPSSVARHIYSVPLPSLVSSEAVEPTSLTDASGPAYYDADFSPQAGFYLLSYSGPHIPWQKIVRVDDHDFKYVLTENPQLNATLNQYELPVVSHLTIDSDGYELNVLEMRPPRMDDSGRTKYPVLFHVYGGPGSQKVDVKFSHDWHDFVVCSLQYIVVIVDGRGTGFKGRKLRNPVKNNLGYYETQDQINAAKIWAAKEYVDSKRIGIWGWSYGGFMSSKVVEANAGIHSLAMAVAPVSSWHSIYTERYMNLPDVNPAGYVTASISNVTGFHNVNYLLAHGSGDDNVHYANSAHLLDMFTQDKVRDFRFRMFTDSDHGISRRGAYRELYEFMTDFLIEKWGSDSGNGPYKQVNRPWS